MTGYANIYDTLPWHRKVLAVSEDDRIGAFGLYVACCVFCQTYLTDGFIAYGQMPAVFPCSEDQRNRLAKHLVDAGLLDKVDGGIEVHDYLDHNRSKEQIADSYKRMSDGGRKGGSKKPGKAQVKVASKPTLQGFTEKSRDSREEKSLGASEAREALDLAPDPSEAVYVSAFNDDDPMPL